MKSRKAILKEQMMRRFGQYIVENKATIRKTAEVFKESRSTVHTYVRKYLKNVDYSLYLEVEEVIKYNNAMRGKRGGEAMRRRHAAK